MNTQRNSENYGLGALPVHNPDRPNLRDVVPWGPKKLASMARKYLTLSPEFAPNPIALDRRPLPRKPIYPAWTRCTPLACVPFESGRNTLPGMEAFAS